jgi:hypothetical protein
MEVKRGDECNEVSERQQTRGKNRQGANKRGEVGDCKPRTGRRLVMPNGSTTLQSQFATGGAGSSRTMDQARSITVTKLRAA